jgi:UDP-N-acetylmuramate dehydrogenase
MQELTAILEVIRAERVPYFLLGLGSNVLISDSGFAGVVIRPKGEFIKIEVQGHAITAGPMARLFDVTIRAFRHSLSGMESLCGIPGSVGGGLYMNAGAFGSQISDVLEQLELIETDGSIRVLKRAEIDFGYRTAPRLQNGIILRSWFSLQERDRREIWARMREVWEKRHSTQPLDKPSAGSVFKRPPGDFAGRLIEATGAKGLRIGGAAVSEKHGNFFVNMGGATAADMMALIRKVRLLVYEKFGVLLETEVKPIGFAEDPFAIER